MDNFKELIVEYNVLSFRDKKRVQNQIMRLNMIFVECFNDDNLLNEYKSFLKGEEVEKNDLKQYIKKNFNEEIEQYDAEYLAECCFREILVYYSLIIWLNCIEDVALQYGDCNIGILAYISDILDEKLYIKNKCKNTNILMSLSSSKFQKLIIAILNNVMLKFDCENDMKMFQEEVRKLY